MFSARMRGCDLSGAGQIRVFPLDAHEVVRRGLHELRSLLDPVATARVPGCPRDGGQKEDERLSELTEQERGIFDLTGEDMTNRELGAELRPAEKTVKNHVSSLLAKPGMERRTQAAAYVAKMHATEG
jgi:DNA-binding CsgD family transcriptional regulator